VTCNWLPTKRHGATGNRNTKGVGAGTGADPRGRQAADGVHRAPRHGIVERIVDSEDMAYRGGHGHGHGRKNHEAIRHNLGRERCIGDHADRIALRIGGNAADAVRFGVCSAGWRIVLIGDQKAHNAVGWNRVQRHCQGTAGDAGRRRAAHCRCTRAGAVLAERVICACGQAGDGVGCRPGRAATVVYRDQYSGGREEEVVNGRGQVRVTDGLRHCRARHAQGRGYRSRRVAQRRTPALVVELFGAAVPGQPEARSLECVSFFMGGYPWNGMKVQNAAAAVGCRTGPSAKLWSIGCCMNATTHVTSAPCCAAPLPWRRRRRGGVPWGRGGCRPAS